MSHNHAKDFGIFSSYTVLTSAEREGKGLTHIVHVPIALRCRKCIQRIDARHIALSSFCQGLCDNICETAPGRRPGPRFWISNFGAYVCAQAH
jgi:hypothetical protein